MKKKQEKKQIATKLRTKSERLMKVPVFLTEGWLARKEAIARRVNRKQKIKDVPITLYRMLRVKRTEGS